MSWAEGRTGISSRAISSRVFLRGSVTESNVSDEIQENPWKWVVGELEKICCYVLNTKCLLEASGDVPMVSTLSQYFWKFWKL